MKDDAAAPAPAGAHVDESRRSVPCRRGRAGAPCREDELHRSFLVVDDRRQPVEVAEISMPRFGRETPSEPDRQRFGSSTSSARAISLAAPAPVSAP